jgi:hypothetical protein
MACDLLSKGWSTDEVNQRLGHKPSSREIDKYVNWLALDRRKPKRKLHQNQVATLTAELDARKSREKLQQRTHSVKCIWISGGRIWHDASQGGGSCRIASVTGSRRWWSSSRAV